MFANIVWPPKLENIHHDYMFLVQTIDGNCISGNSLAQLANILKTNNFANIPPSKVVVVGGYIKLDKIKNEGHLKS